MVIARPQKVRLATVGILALVLGAGFLLGAVWSGRSHAATAAARENGEYRGGEREERRPALYEKVSPALSPEQLVAARAILARRREGARAIMAEPQVDSLYRGMKAAERRFKEVYDPRFRALIDTARAAVRQIMTPAQAARYDSLLAEEDRRRRHGGGDGD